MKQKNPITISKFRYYIKEDKEKTDKKIQTDNVASVDYGVQVRIPDSNQTEQVIKKQNKKFNWNYKEFKQKAKDIKYSSIAHIGNKDGIHHLSNVMMSAGKSPFRNYDKNKDVGIGKNNNQGWRI